MSQMQADLFTAADAPNVTYRPGAFRHILTLFPLHCENVGLFLCQYAITMYGKEMARPRLESWWHDDPTRLYRFGGGEPMRPHSFDECLWLKLLRSDVENATGERFDSCFANYYRGGTDSIDWHADDEPWIGPVIASVSFGAWREFQFKRKREWPSKIAARYQLGHGDLLVMHAGVQDEWLHRVPKIRKHVGPRLNLTFRQTVRT